MSVTPEKFRADFPPFFNQTKFPDPTVSFWLAVAYQLLNPDRWGTTLDLAAELFTAHNITLEYKTQGEVNVGNIPGLSKGMISAQSVDKVSETYDTAGAMEEKAGHWNLTIYGTRFIQLARYFGAGPVQVNGPTCAPPFGGPAWPGPFPWGY